MTNRAQHPAPRVLLAPLTALCVLLAACDSIPTGLRNEPVGAYDRPYPRELPQSRVVDVQVLRGPETTISMTNTTAETFGPSTLWLNGRFSRPITGFAPGQTLELNLYNFRDEHGEKFRGGGFFATKPPEKIVHAQLETLENGESTLVGLIVVSELD